MLRRLGGREIAAMAGAILAARLQRIPVVLDGYVATAAAAILHAIAPSTPSTIASPGIFAAEGAHQEVLARLGKIPLLALGMRLGEGSGAALAAGLVKAAAPVHRDMATFGQAGSLRATLVRRLRPPLRKKRHQSLIIALALAGGAGIALKPNGRTSKVGPR